MAEQASPEMKITDEMVDVYEDTQTAARLAGFGGGLRGWPLVQYQVRAGLIAVAPLLQEAAYQAGFQAGAVEGYERGRHAAASDILARLAVVLRYVEDNSGSEEEA